MEEIKKIRARDEIPTEDKWAVEDLYPSDEAWEEALAGVAAKKDDLAAYAGRLGESGETLYNFLYEDEMTGVTVSRLANYCMRCHDVDTRNPVYQAMSGKFMSVMVAMQAERSFETPEIMAISDEQLEQFYKDFPKLERYRRLLTNIRRRKAHALSAAEEKLLASEIPNYTGLETKAAVSFAESRGFAVTLVGEGKYVTSQSPKAQSLYSGETGKMVFYTDDTEPKEQGVPDVVGKTLIEANRAITDAGFNLRISGAYDADGEGGAVVVSQTPLAGEKAQDGSVISIELRYMIKDD